MDRARKSIVQDGWTGAGPGVKMTDYSARERSINATSLIQSSKTGRIEKPCPKLLKRGGSVVKTPKGGGPAGIERIIKHLHAQDACMRNGTRLTNEAESKLAKSVGKCRERRYDCKALLSRLLLCVVSALFFSLGIFSIYTIIDRREDLDAGLTGMAEIIESVEIPSIENTYYISKEYKEDVREAFEYLYNKEAATSDPEGEDWGTKQVDMEERKASGMSNEEGLLVDGSVKISSSAGDANRSGLSIENYNSTGNNNVKIDVDLLKREFQIGGDEYSELNERQYDENEGNGTSLMSYVLNKNYIEYGLDVNNTSIIELLCYPQHTYQEGIMNLYYRELEYNINKDVFDDEIVKQNSVFKSVLDDDKLRSLGFERPFELIAQIATDNGGVSKNIIKVSRKAIVSSGYNNKRLESLCMDNGQRWLCNKYEILVFKLLFELYNTEDTFMSLFLREYRKNIIRENRVDNITFFAKYQIEIVKNLYPELLESYFDLRKGIYDKVNRHFNSNGGNGSSILENVKEHDINWLISFVISHSIKDREASIAFSPYYVIFPHNSSILDDQDKYTVFHSVNNDNNSVEWNYNGDVEKKNTHRKVYTHYGKLNNIKLLFQYGKVLFNNEYFTTWFIRGKKGEISFKYSTSVAINRLNSKVYRELLPDWLVDIGNVRLNVNDDYLHYISSDKSIDIKPEEELRGRKNNGASEIECNEYTFYNGVGIGFGTIQFDSAGTVGGIRSSAYICLRKLIHLYMKREGNSVTAWESERILVGAIYNSCCDRFDEFSKKIDLLIQKLNSYQLSNENRVLNYSNKLKQEVRISVKLLFSIYEELNTMKKCKSYFYKLINV